MNNDQELLKIKTKDKETKELICRTENHDHENIEKSIEIDIDYKKKFNGFKKKFLELMNFYSELLQH